MQSFSSKRYSIIATAIFFLCYLTGNAQSKLITIGSGGGFTGGASVFTINADGRVLKGKGLGEIKYTEESKMKKRKVNKLFKEASSLTSGEQFNHPGNMYYFISYSENNSEQKITWGDPQVKAPDNITTLYQSISSQLSKLKFSPIH